MRKALSLWGTAALVLAAQQEGAAGDESKVVVEREEKEYEAFLAATDSKVKLAFLKIEDLGDRKLAAVDFGSPVDAAIGQTVVALGRQKKGYDYAPFVEAGVPALFFFTGFHEDYHESTDHADKLDYAAMEKIGRAAARLVVDVPERMKPRPARNLGILVAGAFQHSALEKTQAGLWVAEVRKGSMAESAGIRGPRDGRLAGDLRALRPGGLPWREGPSAGRPAAPERDDGGAQ